MDRQILLPFAASENRDAAYRAELDRADLPAAARRVAGWMLSVGQPHRTADGERLYCTAASSTRDLAARSKIPRATLQRGLEALAAADPVVLWRAGDTLCLVASRLAELPDAPAVVPVATTDDWGRVSIPRSRPAAPPTAGMVGTGPAVAHSGPVRPSLAQGGPQWPSLAQSGPPVAQPDLSSISARAQVVVVGDIEFNNNQPDPADVWDLARAVWGRIHSETRYPPRVAPAQRLLLLRLATLALASDLGDAWLHSAAAARPLRGDRHDRTRFFHAAAAYQAWELAAGQPPEEADRRRAKARLHRALAAVDLPAELLATPQPQKVHA
ncbi:MAG: hypothetical protein GX547_16320 [Phycisphaerae bacterium]|nr:hypothetical protein [Phycisphaerae bacterium]